MEVSDTWPGMHTGTGQGKDWTNMKSELSDIG